jgi:hypothetical protein
MDDNPPSPKSANSWSTGHHSSSASSKTSQIEEGIPISRTKHTVPQDPNTETRPLPPGSYPQPEPISPQSTSPAKGSDYPTSPVQESSSSGGIRISPHLPRGIYTSFGPRASSLYLPTIQTILYYQFKTPDLLEEALESPGSGVTATANGKRRFLDGNKGLAIVGEGVMKLMLKDLAYLYHMDERKSSALLFIVYLREGYKLMGIGDRQGVKNNLFSY